MSGTADSFGFQSSTISRLSLHQRQSRSSAADLQSARSASRRNPANIGVDKNALAILESNLIPVANSPIGCNFIVTNLDPTDPNHCYNAAVSPSTYWREELFRIDQINHPEHSRASFRYVHDAWDTSVLTPQWGIVRNTFPTVQNRFTGPGTSLVASLTYTISPTLLNNFVASYVNSNITLVDQNGPGNACSSAIRR